MADEANQPQPPIKLEDAPLIAGDIILMHLPLDLTSSDSTSEATWTPTTGSGAPRHPVVWISGTATPQGCITIYTVTVFVMRSFRTSEAATLVVQNSPSSRFFLSFPSPPSMDATPTTPTEFGLPLQSPFFRPVHQTWLHARTTCFDVRSDITVILITFELHNMFLHLANADKKISAACTPAQS